MFFINVFSGGSVQHGHCGVHYSQGPTVNFLINNDATLAMLKEEIYRYLGISECHFDLKIRAKFNTSPPPGVFFTELELLHDTTWRFVVDNMGNWKVLDLFVDLIPKSRTGLSQPIGSHHFANSSQVVAFDINDPPLQTNSPILENQNLSLDNNSDAEDFEFEIELDDITPQERVNHMVNSDATPIGNTFSDDNYNAMHTDDFIEVDEENDNENENAMDSNDDVPGWLFRDRSDSHPVASFNAIEGIVQLIGDGNFFNEASYATDTSLAVGQVFRTKDHLKWVVHDFHINANRTFRVKKSNKKVYTVICTNQNCNWRIYAKRRSYDDAFEIQRRKGPHSCVVSADRLEHPHLTAPFIASIIREHIKKNVRYLIKDIKVDIEQRYRFKAPYMRCWRAKEIAIAQLFGGWKQAYNLIKPLLEAMQRNNPGTKIEWFTEPTNNPNYRYFEGVCWAFGPAIRAFEHCRPIIGIDATFLSGRYKGRLMTACGYDAEDQLVPLAFGLFDKENNKSWERFMKFVRREVVGLRVVCVISDRHPSILRVFKEPDLGWNVQSGHAVHRFCSRHIVQNFQRNVKDKDSIPRVRAIIRQNQPRKFHAKMAILAAKNQTATKWLEDIERRDENDDPLYHLWSLAYDQGGCRWGIMTTNGPESLNNVFKEARELPVTSVVEITFYKSIKYFAERRTKAEQIINENLVFARKVENLLEKRRLKGNTHTVTPYRNERKFEVVSRQRQEGNKIKRGKKQWVQLDPFQGGICTCQKPQLTGIPCSHVLAACATQSIASNQHVSPYFRASELMATWAPEFYYFGDLETWPQQQGPILVPDPSMYKVVKGRRQHVRIRNEMDDTGYEKHTYTCGQCGQQGHNRRTCTNNPNNQGN